MELDWISDAVLSIALGVAVYLWLHLRATRRALTERERAQLVIQTQLSLAEAMQRRLLPPVPDRGERTRVGGRSCMPAGRIGGDFFDFLEPARRRPPDAHRRRVGQGHLGGDGPDAASVDVPQRRPRHAEPRANSPRACPRPSTTSGTGRRT